MNDTISSALQWRYATKAFDPGKKISDQDWDTLADSLVLTPSSFGLQPWKFLVIKDAGIRESLVEHSWGQRQVADCSHFVVLLHRLSIDEDYVDKWVEKLAETQNRSADDLAGYKGAITGFTAPMGVPQMSAWNQRQAYIALGQLMTTAALLKIDTCPMEGIVPAKYDEILGLEGSDFTTSVACALGYRSADDKYASAPKARFDASEMIEYR